MARTGDERSMLSFVQSASGLCFNTLSLVTVARTGDERSMLSFVECYLCAKNSYVVNVPSTLLLFSLI
jgi:hypothetical protein